MKRIVLAAFVIAVCTAAAGAEQSQAALTLEKAVEFIVTNNPDLKNALDAVLTARKDVGSVFTLESSSLSLSETYSSGSSGTSGSSQPSGGQSAGFSGSAQLSVPVIPQVSLSSKISQTGSGDVSLSLKPFESWAVNPAKTETLKKAEAKYADLLRKTGANAENVLLSGLMKAADADVASKNLELQKALYEVKKKMYDLGEISLGDLQDGLSKYSTAEQQYYSAKKSELQAEKDIRSLLGSAAESVGLGEITAGDLARLISERDAAVEAKKNAALSSLTVKNAAIELESLGAQLGNTPFWKPDFSVSANLSFPSLNYSVGASLKLSPSDFNAEERRDLESKIATKRSDLATQENLLKLDREMLARTLEITKLQYAAALLEVERNTPVLEETRLLHEKGERTILELRQSELDMEKAMNSVFQQAAGVLKAQNDILLLFAE